MALTKPAGTWTYDDLFLFPDDGKRYEIIDGELYEMPAPNWNHAVTIASLMGLLAPIVEALRGELVTAPVDVFFAGADPVEPDIIVLLPDSRATPVLRGVEGPPDLLIEVISPSNPGHDRLTKRALYTRAGVREYWLVDPTSRTIDLLTIDRDASHSIQTATGDTTMVSPVLGGAAFSLTAVFARVRGFEG
ncbi:MAG: Uma2 family endonuclease [Chloroflexia bacterium]|nr:Uma2 family endonuclease [Chloroflexia bacterium]